MAAPINDKVTPEKLNHYFSVTSRALTKAGAALDDSSPERKAQAEDFLDMAQRYFDDAGHFRERGDYVLAFAALNYAHGWLDAGARSKLFRVNDSTLFTVDEE